MSKTSFISDLKGPIAVFGAGGFIGARLVEILMSERNDVFAITQQSIIPWRLTDVARPNLIKCDQTNPQDVRSLFSRLKPQTVFAFAAYGAYARQSNQNLIFQTNFGGVLNLLNAAAEFGTNAFVHAGSSSEYGTNCTAPLESDPLMPNSDYAVSKIAAAYLIAYYAKHKGVPATNLRLYSIYGPYEESDRLIPRIIEYGIQKSYPPLVNPETSRDFVYVDDAIQAAVLAARPKQESIYGRSINIASGQLTTLKDLATIAGNVFEIPRPPVWNSMPNRQWDTEKWYGNPSLAKTLLGWQASTSLHEGLILTKEWQMKKFANSSRQVASVTARNLDKISAIIACYKDEQAVPFMYDRLKKTFEQIGCDYEIIFVNDASPDNASTAISKICDIDYRVIMIEHSRNFGSQSAFVSGMELASGDAIVLLDGDLQDPPELIVEFFEKWKEGYEVVYGQRVAREATLLLQYAYKAFYRLFKAMANINIPADAGDFSLMDKTVVQQILKFPERDHFIRGLRAWVGYRQVGVPYVRPERMFGQTTNNLRKNFWWARKGIFSFSFAPLEWLIYSSGALFLLSIAAIIAQIAVKLAYPEIPHGIPTIIVLILFFGSLNLSAFAILGEYIGKIVEESKGRPKFIRRRLIIAGREIRQGVEIDQILRERTSETRSF